MKRCAKWGGRPPPLLHDRSGQVGLGHPAPPPSAVMVSAAIRRFLVACALVQVAEPLAAQGVQAPPLTVHSIWGSREFATDRVGGPGPAGGFQAPPLTVHSTRGPREFASDLVDVAWMKDGKAYTAVEAD